MTESTARFIVVMFCLLTAMYLLKPPGCSPYPDHRIDGRSRRGDFVPR